MASKSRPCVRCHKDIPAERIEALPETRLCVECSAAVGGDFDVVLSSENLGKSGSLKKNYGGIKVKKVRKQIRTVEEEQAQKELDARE